MSTAERHVEPWRGPGGSRAEWTTVTPECETFGRDVSHTARHSLGRVSVGTPVPLGGGCEGVATGGGEGAAGAEGGGGQGSPLDTSEPLDGSVDCSRRPEEDVPL